MMRISFKHVVYSGLFLLNAAAATAQARKGPIPEFQPGVTLLCDSKNHRDEYANALTVGEAKFIESIFDNTFDTTGVRLYFNASGKRYPSNAAICSPHAIEFLGDSMHVDDYSKAGIEPYGSFIHEITHLWLEQNGQFTACTAGNRYEYVLNPERRFTEYCDEQQASIIKDYARRFLHPERGPTLWLKPSKTPWYKPWQGTDTRATDALLAKVVEDQFPRARVTRLAPPKP